MKKLFNNNKSALYAIFALIALAVLFWANRSEADEVTRLEIGPTVLSGQYSDGVAVMVSEIFNDRYLIGFGLIGQQTGKFNEGDVQVGNNIMLQAQFLVQGPDKWAWARQIELGLGLAYFQETNRVFGRNLTFSLSLGYEKPDRWWRWLPDHYTYRHYSNAGSGSPNAGQDLLFMFGYDFDY